MQTDISLFTFYAVILISVITCTYNAAASLQRTLDSVGCQTYPAIEHLIIDGASTDNTLALAEAYRQAQSSDKSRRVLVTSEPDKGLYDAMNKGLQKATGDYVLFLNAGDTFPSSETLADVCRAAEASLKSTGSLPAVLYGDTDIVDGNGHRLRSRRLRPPKHLSWLSFRQGMVVCHQAFYVRTDLARETPYDLRYRFSADVDWCIRVMKHAKRQQLELRNLNQVVACYLEEGMTTRHHRESLVERFRVMTRHYGLLVTAGMHLWFVVRALPLLFRRFKKND